MPFELSHKNNASPIFSLIQGYDLDHHLSTALHSNTVSFTDGQKVQTVTSLQLQKHRQFASSQPPTNMST